MDAEKFRSQWWSSPQASASLEIEEWMEETFAKPASFWNSIISLQTTLSPRPPQSVLEQYYDFYHDCVARHIESNNALLFVDESGFAQSWTYKKLHRLINFQVKAWLKSGVKTGQQVAIVMPVGAAYLVALLTALRLGLQICFLPLGSRFLGTNHSQNLLEELDPDVVVTVPNAALQRTSTVVVDILEEDDIPHEPTSYAYPAKQTVQCCLALYRKEPFAFVTLDAHTTYLHALRDGLLTLNLRPGISYGTLHACPIRSEPCSTLMTLLCGATYAHAAEAALFKDPEIIKNERFHLIEISPSLQKLWAKTPAAPKQLKGFYKTPLHHHLHAWRFFIEANKLESVPTFHLLLDNSLGGVVFFSKPTTKELDFYLKPSLGTPWTFKDLITGEDSHKGFGEFSVGTSCKENNTIPSNLLVSQMDKNCLISSALLPTREGVTIPIELIEEAAQELPFVESCILYTFPKMGETAHHQCVLLVFVDPLKKEISDEMKQAWSQQISAQISTEAGPAFVPDHIAYFALIPKMQGSNPDRNWCIEQYNRGFLSKKAKLPIYQILNMLKKELHSDG
jgi:hypothetical protein